MLAQLIVVNFLWTLFAVLFGVALLWFWRRKTDAYVAAHRRAGFWVRTCVFGTDLAIVQLLALLVAYHGRLGIAGVITMLVTFSYFFFFWLFFATTPAGMLARIRIGRDGRPLALWQVLARIGTSLLLIVGWVPMLFNNDRRALHDFAARTAVVYAGEPPQIRPLKRIHGVVAGVVFLAFASLVVYGGGERIARYADAYFATAIDVDADGMTEAVALDMDGDGIHETYKYDYDNDHIVDMSAYDANADGVAESIDENNDGRIDGFDFDYDGIYDIEHSPSQRAMTLWTWWFVLLSVSFVAACGFAIWYEKRRR